MTIKELLALPDDELLKELQEVLPGQLKLDWNTAMEWFRETEGAIDCLFAIWQHIDNNTEDLEMWGDWLCLNARPKHLLIAAARKNEG